MKRGYFDKVDITYLYPLPRIFPIRSVADLTDSLVDEYRIEKRLMFNIDSIEPEKKVIYSIEGKSIEYDPAITIPPHRGAKVIIDSEIGDDEEWLPMISIL